MSVARCTSFDIYKIRVRGFELTVMMPLEGPCPAVWGSNCWLANGSSSVRQVVARWPHYLYGGMVPEPLWLIPNCSQRLPQNFHCYCSFPVGAALDKMPEWVTNDTPSSSTCFKRMAPIT